MRRASPCKSLYPVLRCRAASNYPPAWKPGYSALRSEAGERRTVLVAEAHKRMAHTDYPPFPQDLNLGSREDQVWAIVIESGGSE
jgi:hypothetical protein